MTETHATLRVGRLDLFRRSVVPAAPWATLAIVHGYGDHSGRHAHAMHWLAERGVACHALDLRGHGRSPGRRGYVRKWDEYLDDLRALMAALPSRASTPTFLFGHSHGGLIAAAAVIRGIVDVEGCILSSPYFGMRLAVPWHKRWLAHALNATLPWLRIGSGLSQDLMTGDEVMRRESAADPLLLRTATPRWFLATRVAQGEMLANAARFTSPLLVLFGGVDGLAEIGAAERFFADAGSADKAMKIYPTLRHELLREISRESVLSDVLEWLKIRAGC